VKQRTKKGSGRRTPKQRRARLTVEAILDAVVRILKREGVGAVTTNRIAEVAGVSVGSVYQYFPNKGAIFLSLHRRHVENVDRVIQATLVEHSSSPLEGLVRALVEAMVEAHRSDMELHDLLSTEVPHRGGGTRDFALRLQGAFRLAVASRQQELRKNRDLDMVAFTGAQMFEALCHGVTRRPAGLGLTAAKEEVVKAVLSYLRA